MKQERPKCPYCKQVMTEVMGSYGPFWGCPDYWKAGVRCPGTREMLLIVPQKEKNGDN